MAYYNRKIIIRNCLTLCCCLIAVISHAQTSNTPDTLLAKQKDVIGIAIDILNIKKKHTDSARSNKKIQFSLLPSAGAAPGGGAAFVTALNAAFYTKNSPKTSLSTVTFTPWFSFNGKFVLPFRNFIWLPDNKYLAKGDTRFMIYPQYTWGLGNTTNNDKKILIEYDYLRVYQSLLRKVNKSIMIGGGYNLDHHYNLSAPSDSALSAQIPFFDHYKSSGNNSTSSGPVINFLIDLRQNQINPDGGIYFGIDYRFNTTALGSTSDWQSIFADARKYVPFKGRQRNLLAFWAYYWAVTNGNAPYLDLPSIGWDYYNRSGRGYQQNRYRGEQLIYFESEYRRSISKNGLWGFVVFANIHSVTEYKQNQGFDQWHPAAGAGVRIKFNKISNTNIAIDFAASKDYAGIYLGLGEAF